MDKIARRIELLKLEGFGLSQIEIVKDLSAKAGCSERTIYSDFETRERWQPILQNLPKPEAVLMKIVNRFEQIYRRASIEHIRAEEGSTRLGALNLMLKANSLLFETAVLPEFMSRLKAVEEKAQKGVFVP